MALISTPLMVEITMHLVGSDIYRMTTIGFIAPQPSLTSLKKAIVSLFTSNQFNISAHQPLALSCLDAKNMSFSVHWTNTGAGIEVQKCDVLAGDVQDLMEILEGRGWRDVLEVKVSFDVMISSGLKTMTEGERAAASKAKRKEKKKVEFDDQSYSQSCED